jgi:hypothetical protein
MKINKTYLNVKYNTYIWIAHHFLENHFLNTQGEDQVKKESEIIQRKIYRDNFFLCYKEKSNILNGMFMPKKLCGIKVFN